MAGGIRGITGQKVAADLADGVGSPFLFPIKLAPRRNGLLSQSVSGSVRLFG